MTKTIQRFDLEIIPDQRINVPWNAEILGFSMFNGKPGFSAIVDLSQKWTERHFHITTLNKDLPQAANETRLLGEFQLPAGDKMNIFYVFEV